DRARSRNPGHGRAAARACAPRRGCATGRRGSADRPDRSRGGHTLPARDPVTDAATHRERPARTRRSENKAARRKRSGGRQRPRTAGMRADSRSRTALLVRFHFRAYLLHVELTHTGDDALERARGQRTGLAEDHHAVADGSDRRNRTHLEGTGQFALRLGVDLAEDDVRMGFGGGLEGRREAAARRTPLGPEIEQHDATGLDDGVEVLGGDFAGGHGYLLEY